MKDKFIYKDGLIYTNDKKNKKVEEFKTYKYQDNISDILATENILEDLENNKNNILKNNQKLLDKYIKKKDKVILLGGIGLIGVMFIYCILSALQLTFPILILSTLGVFAVYVETLTFVGRKVENNYKKKKNYNFGKLDKINEEININLKKLLDLDMNTKKEFEDNYKDKGVVEVNYKEKLIELRKLIKLYGNIASNKDKYKKYYEKDIIDKKLEKEYNEEERKLIKKYFNDVKKSDK